MDPKNPNPSAEIPTSDATTPVAGPTTDQSGADTTTPDSEVPKTPVDDPTRQGETVPYDKFRDTRRELQEARRLLAQFQSAPATTERPPAPSQVIPSQYLDEDGNVSDIVGYTQWAQETAASRAVEQALQKIDQRDQLRRFEESERSETLRKYPFLKDDSDTMDTIETLKKGSLLKGELVSLPEVAEKYFKNLEKAAKRGADQVTEQRRIQETVTPAPTAKVISEEQEMGEIKERMRSKDRQVREKARIEYLIRLNKK